MVHRIVELTAVQLAPVAIGKAIAVAKRLANIRRIVWVGSLQPFFLRKNRPVDNGTIRNHLFHAIIERRKDGRCPAKASANHKDFIGSYVEPLAEGKLAN